MNLVDLVALLIVLVTIYLGARSGFTSQALALAGFALGALIVFLIAPFMAGPLEGIDQPLRGLIALGGMATIVLLAQAGGSALGTSMRRRMGRGVLGSIDNAAGAVFGMVRGLFLVWLAGGLIALAPLPVIQAEARQSLILRVMDSQLPSPVVLAAQLGRVIEAAGLPTDVFVGVTPEPAQPVDGPTQQAADRMAAGALGSTVRVEAIACGRFFSGTAFAVAPDRFVTNAHVVAGADKVWVSFDGAFDRHTGHVVVFDPELDAALIYTPGLNVAPLELAGSVPQRGQQAAAVGFPGGGRQEVIAAAVTRSLEALGRDIYGEQTVAREVVEMVADVRPGDSGGPLLLPDGTVGGVTFSESRDNPDIGYALSPVEVAAAIDPALGRTDEVSTQACLTSLD